MSVSCPQPIKGRVQGLPQDGPGTPAACPPPALAPAGLRVRHGRAAVPGCPRRPAQRKPPRPDLARGPRRRPCRKTGQAPSRPAAPTTFAMPRCRCGWAPAPRPPRSLPAPGTARVSCSPSMPTAYPAATRSPASTSSKLSAPAGGPPLAHKNRCGRRESCPSCVRATAGRNGTQLDLKPPPRSGYTSVTCGNADRGGRFHGSRPRAADAGRSGPLSL